MYLTREPWDYRSDNRSDDYDEPRPGLDRLTHLVLVDGRLVDMWSEPVRGTRWQRYADEIDRERRPPDPPPPPAYVRTLEWLTDVCGSAAALEALDAEPLSDLGTDLPETTTLRERHVLERAAELLDAAAEQCFDAEVGIALRRCLLKMWDLDRDACLRVSTPAHLAAGICWAVGKANLLFGPHGPATQKAVQERIGLPPLSGPGQLARRVLRGFGPFSGRPRYGDPDYEPLGHPDLLTGSTRAALVRMRDRALEAKTAAPAAVLP
jgi:hypothetical protein